MFRFPLFLFYLVWVVVSFAYSHSRYGPHLSLYYQPSSEPWWPLGMGLTQKESRISPHPEIWRSLPRASPLFALSSKREDGGSCLARRNARRFSSGHRSVVVDLSLQQISPIQETQAASLPIHRRTLPPRRHSQFPPERSSSWEAAPRPTPVNAYVAAGPLTRIRHWGHSIKTTN